MNLDVQIPMFGSFTGLLVGMYIPVLREYCNHTIINSLGFQL